MGRVTLARRVFNYVLILKIKVMVSAVVLEPGIILRLIKVMVSAVVLEPGIILRLKIKHDLRLVSQNVL